MALAGLTAPAPAQAGSKSLFVGQFRRTVEDSERSASGEVRSEKDGLKQTFSTTIAGLGEESFAIFVSTNAPAFNTNDLVSLVAQIDRTNEKKGAWERTLVGSGGAPAAIPLISDLDDLQNSYVVIAKPGPDLLVGVTNIVGGVTNIIVGLPAFAVGPVTGTVFAVLWAPVDSTSTALKEFSTKGSQDLALPPSPRPSPAGKGVIKTKYVTTRGQSILDISVSGLLRGQVYSVWVGDASVPTVYVKAGKMEISKNGSSARFVRDTRFGDPLPQQVRDVRDLSGRPVLILDEFEDVHLTGVIP